MSCPRAEILHTRIGDQCVTLSVTLWIESPCRIRKLITAEARIGNTLSCGLPLNMVGAVVVRKDAAVAVTDIFS